PQTSTLVARVLIEALAAPADCEAFLRWAEAAGLEGTQAALCQQAIFRGDHESALRHAAGLSDRDAAGFTAAAAFLRGDLLAANEALDAAVTGKRAPSCGHAAPILAMLLLERDDPKATAAARRVMSAAADARTGRAFRLFLR